MYRSPLSALLLILLLPAFAGPLHAQSVADLEARLKRATSKSDKLTLNYQLAEKLLAGNPAKSATYATAAAQIATEIGDKRKEADATFLSAEGQYRSKNYRAASSNYNAAWNAARNYGLRDVALNSTERLQDIALKQNDFKEALKWSRETVNYLKDAGGGTRSGGDAMRRLEDRLSTVEAENRNLRDQLANATGQSQQLETTFRQTEAQLKETQEKTQQELSQKQATISQISQAKQRSDSLVRTKASMVEFLTKEQLADSILIERAARQLEERGHQVAEAEFAKKVLGLLAALIFVLAGAFYMRYRAKRRAANDLSAKNIQIEEERRRSDELLLNILPPAIAKELKLRNKVSAQKYEKATVMFIDFIGFTSLAEKLSPERLVEELDFCFSNFDRIIGQYRIEKIKTIGDAYMCAGGLPLPNKTHPEDAVRAALEMVAWLENRNRNNPAAVFREMRVGIHTGQVIAGVIGKNKFAYDIWGDAVNLAARLEEEGASNQVNISGTTFEAVKNRFDCTPRGRREVRNKGLVDMYFIKQEKGV